MIFVNMKLHHMVMATFVLCTFKVKTYSNKIPSLSCGRRLVKHESLIVDGYNSKEGFWPWHASIFHVGLDWDINYKCGGTLLNSNVILTASHCVYENGQPIIADRISIQLGRNNLKTFGSNTKDFEAYRIISHPNFNSSNLRNDIAIIELATQVTFNDYIQPICLWSADKKDLSEVEGRLGTVVGFGVTKTGNISQTLQEAVMPVVSTDTCLGSNRDLLDRFHSKSTFCAGFRNGTTACNGDSGGSIVFKDKGVYRIRGIVSLTPVRSGEQGELCDVDEYVVFTDVAQYLPWIQENVPVLPSPSISSEDHNAKTDVPTTNATVYFDELIQSLNVPSDRHVVLNFINLSHWQHSTEPSIDIRLFNYVLGTIWSQWYCHDTGYLTNRTFYIDYVKKVKDSLNKTSLGDFNEYEFISRFRDVIPPVVGITPESKIDISTELPFFSEQSFKLMNLVHRIFDGSCFMVESYRKIRKTIFDLNDEKLSLLVSEFTSEVFTFTVYLSINFEHKYAISDDDKKPISLTKKSILNYMLKSFDTIEEEFYAAFPNITFKALKYEIELFLKNNAYRDTY